MTRKEKSLILAMALGDGCVKINTKNGKPSSGVFHINHSTKQRAYIEWKHNKFQEILGKNIKLTDRYVKGGNGKYYDIITFAVVDSYFKILRRFLYKGGEKRIGVNSLKRLDELGLAILYLDDGSLLHRKTKSGKMSGIAVRLHISMYEHEINPIIKFFKDNWDIEFGAYREHAIKKVYLLYANTENAIKFLNIVKKPILEEIKCMRYKIDTPYLI